MRSEPTQIPHVSRRTLPRAGATNVCGLGAAGAAAATDRGFAKRTADVGGQGLDGDVVAVITPNQLETPGGDPDRRWLAPFDPETQP